MIPWVDIIRWYVANQGGGPAVEEDVKSRLVKYLDTLEEMTRAGADTAAEQLPDIAQQFVAWHLWSSVMWFTLWATILGVSTCGIVKLWRLAESEDCDLNGEAIAFFLTTLLVSFIASSIGFIVTAGWTLKALVAPKLLILEEVARLIGSAT